MFRAFGPMIRVQLVSLSTLNSEPRTKNTLIAPAPAAADAVATGGGFAGEVNVLGEELAGGIPIGAHGGVSEGAALPGLDVGALTEEEAADQGGEEAQQFPSRIHVVGGWCCGEGKSCRAFG
jgi:hypothetical protein